MGFGWTKLPVIVLAVTQLQQPNWCNITWRSGLFFFIRPSLRVSSHQTPPENFSKLGTSSSVTDLNMKGLLLASFAISMSNSNNCRICLGQSCTWFHRPWNNLPSTQMTRWWKVKLSPPSKSAYLSLMKSKNLRFLSFHSYPSTSAVIPHPDRCASIALWFNPYFSGGKSSPMAELNRFVKWRFTGSQSLPGWCHFSAAATNTARSVCAVTFTELFGKCMWYYDVFYITQMKYLNMWAASPRTLIPDLLSLCLSKSVCCPVIV